MADYNTNYPNPNNLSQDDSQPLLASGHGANPYLSKQQTSESSVDKIKRDKAVFSFDQAMNQAGGMGLFQYIAITAFSICYVSNGYIFYALTYLELWPDYICGPGKNPEVACDREYMC